MDAHLDLIAIPNDDIAEGAVVSNLMQNIHRLLPSYDGRVGLSFPQYGTRRTVGSCIRAHGSATDIQALHEDLTTTAAIMNYALVVEPQMSPSGASIKGYHAYIRTQPKGASRLRRQEARHRQQGNWSPEVEARYKNLQTERLARPYFSLRSDTNGHRFLLFVDRKVLKEAVVGKFGFYGVNSGNTANSLATVPWFD
jgi:CRISPR-associated endonuclease Csy4